MLAGDQLRNPAAHRPAAQAHLLQPQRIEKPDHHMGLIAHRVGEARGLLAAPVAWQIGQINAVTSLGEIGRQLSPVFGAPAQPMHQHHHRPAGRPLGKIMHAIARNLNRVILHARKALPQIERFIEVADGPLPEANPGN